MLKDLFSNYILLAAVAAWLIAQICKFLIVLLATRKVRAERLFGAGGMPSAHTAMVCSMTIAAARAVGVASPVFAICFIMACIVMYDAMGVRRQAGKHAEAINKIVREEENEEQFDLLKEKLGHTPLEVLGGALLGILVSMTVELVM